MAVPDPNLHRTIRNVADAKEWMHDLARAGFTIDPDLSGENVWSGETDARVFDDADAGRWDKVWDDVHEVCDANQVSVHGLALDVYHEHHPDLGGGPSTTITVHRTYTIRVYGTVTDYIALADDMERLDSRDGGDATGLIVKLTNASDSGEFIRTHNDTTVVASYEDDAFEWSGLPDAPTQ